MRHTVLVTLLLSFVIQTAHAALVDLPSCWQSMTHKNKTTRLRLSIAADPMTRMSGLMHVQHMDRKHGMLFIFPDASIKSMWMKNTDIPLDMIFINAQYKIVKIEKNTKTHSIKHIDSGSIVKYVIEVNAGVSTELGLKVADDLKLDESCLVPAV